MKKGQKDWEGEREGLRVQIDHLNMVHEDLENEVIKVEQMKDTLVRVSR